LNGNAGKINFKTDKFCIDSSVIIAFFNSNLDFILREVFKKKIYFSSGVSKEIKRYDLSNFEHQILDIRTIKESKYFYRISNKHISFSVTDAQLITICKFNNMVCVTFEKKMTKVCRDEDIKSIGLLCILKEAMELKLVDEEEAKRIVIKLKNNGLYLADNVFDGIINGFKKD